MLIEVTDNKLTKLIEVNIFVIISNFLPGNEDKNINKLYSF